ncbi:MAG: alpha/beta hydrolase [Bacteroidota bacterium]
MKKSILLLLLGAFQMVSAQQLVLTKGIVNTPIPINDSIPGSYSVYLPTDFTKEKKWPLVLVLDLDGEEEAVLQQFIPGAEKEGYVLASTHINDSLSLTNNMLKTGTVLGLISSALPIDNRRVYTAGMGNGAGYATLTPIFLKKINGVISVGASLANTEVLDIKRPFHFIGIVGKNDYDYPEMIRVEKTLGRLRFPNHVLLYEEEVGDTLDRYFKKAMQLFKIAAMMKGDLPKDSVYVQKAQNADIQIANALRSQRKLLLAEQYLGEMVTTYAPFRSLDSIREIQKQVRKDRLFKSMRRLENAAFFKETLLKEDYAFYMDEDVRTHNFNNLGWWKYQMDELDKFISGSNVFEKQMGNRLKGFVNALAEDTVELVMLDKVVDEDALAFLYMLKTILEPNNFDYYLKTISLASKKEDFGTALFYVEEALKLGFKDTKQLDALEHTALLRINPKYNALMEKYLKNARYQITE